MPLSLSTCSIRPSFKKNKKIAHSLSENLIRLEVSSWGEIILTDAKRFEGQL